MVFRSRRYIVFGVIGFAVAVALRDTLAKIPLMAIPNSARQGAGRGLNWRVNPA